MGSNKSLDLSLITFFSIKGGVKHFSLLSLEVKLPKGYFNRALVDYYKDSEGRSTTSFLFGLIIL